MFSYEEAYEFSDVSNMRSGRTFQLTLKYQLGKISDDKKNKFGRSQGDDDGSIMDMGY